MAQHLIRVIILGTQLVGRAFAKALKSEFQSGRAAASHRNQSQETVQANRISGMTIEEAKQILNIQDFDAKHIQERFDHLFTVNDKAKGGSFYLQSKVFRAKERLDEEFKLKGMNTKATEEKTESNK